MHGAPALAPNFDHLPYADPDAAKGGRVILGERGGFDSLNPYLLKGRSAWGVRAHVVESLMDRSWDEPFTLYGLLAESVSAPPDRSWVAFRLRPEARFSNGAPVTVDDVIWSMETLRNLGRPNFQEYYSQIKTVERIGDRGVRFVFTAPDRELPLLMGLMPILCKACWADRDFDEPSLEPVIGSGPYVIESVDPERSAVFRRDPNYWGRDLPVNRGRHNFDLIEYQYFRDGGSLWEAFTSGAISYYRDDDPAHWADAYDFPATRDGRILRAEIPHARASGMRGFVFNTRRAPLDDRRVREALTLALDFDWINQRFFGGGYQRITSYFDGSALGFRDPAEGAERTLLEPFAADLPPGALEHGWRPPASGGDGRNRAGLRAARRLLEQAGWSVGEDGALRDAEGRSFSFEILLGESRDERIASVWIEALKTLGVTASPRTVDRAQYADRLNDYDFDVTVRLWWLSLSPGQEQRFYWGSPGRKSSGTRNYMGVADPAVDAMIDALLAADSPERFQAAARALDRVLSSGVYVAPFGFLTTDRLAYRREIHAPRRTALYGFQPDTLWFAAE